jgi:nitrite reductase/ring-hydroxylating ferredoxin subunit/uncharacterized membrane protein
MAMKVADRLIDAMPWLDGVADAMHKAFTPVLGQDAPRTPRDLLYGTWLGHPLHPAVIVMPIGFWSSTMVFDLVGEERAADLSLKLGLVTALGAAATGAAQWQDTVNVEKPRRLGALHAALNIAATGLYAGSWLLRRQGNRGAGVALSTVGLGVNGFSAWLGGDLAYDLGIGVDRTAFERSLPNWTDVLAETDLPDKTPKRVTAADVPVLLYRQDGEIFAISATCTHLGGPLDEGEIDGETVTCPWHGSVFCLRDGKLRHGPATMPEPSFEVRVQDGRIAVRRR